MDLNNVKSKHIVIVEDIVDTGTTMAKLLSLISEAGCESVHVCTLLEKRIEGDLHQSRVKCKYSGFSIPNKFVIGYGLDFNESYRDLDDIWVMSSSGIQFGGKF